MPYTDKQKREHIAELQMYLNRIFPRKVIPDGIYGSETADAVRKLQQRRGLPETGETDSDTWDAVIAEYRHIADSEPLPCHAFPSREHSASEGTEGIHVYIIQWMLNELGKRYDNMMGCDITGIYDASTAAAISGFQRKCGLSPTGNTDRLTWDRLVKCSSLFD